MARSPVGRVLALVLVFLAVLALVVGAYNIGISAGAASAGAGATAGWPGWGHGFAVAYGFPWFFFWPIFPILFIVFVALLLRATASGRGGWGYPHRGAEYWHGSHTENDTQARFEEWHRRAHGGGAGGAGATGGPDTRADSTLRSGQD